MLRNIAGNKSPASPTGWIGKSHKSHNDSRATRTPPPHARTRGDVLGRPASRTMQVAKGLQWGRSFGNSVRTNVEHCQVKVDSAEGHIGPDQSRWVNKYGAGGPAAFTKTYSSFAMNTR